MQEFAERGIRRPHVGTTRKLEEDRASLGKAALCRKASIWVFTTELTTSSLHRHFRLP
jgi:hypothetical protein